MTRYITEPNHTQTMAANAKRKTFLDKPSQAAGRREPGKISEMSPEARRAMLQAREDSKENFITISKPIQQPTQVLGPARQNTHLSVAERSPPRKPAQFPGRGVRDSSLSNRTARASQPTARSRSTLSHTDRASNRTPDPRSNQRNSRKPTVCVNARDNTSNRGLGDENNTSSHNMESLADFPDNKSGFATEAGDDWAQEDAQSLAPGEASLEDQPGTDSFAAALHNALDSNGTDRLRGDITDAARISEPGTVRALNGGRLTNAQEVVVNVCHNDARELVFHDDDHESLETARTISDIRINVWLEYNERFSKDCALESDDNDCPSEMPDQTRDTIPEFKRSQTSMSPGTLESNKTAGGRRDRSSKPPVSRAGTSNKTAVPARTRSAMPTQGALRTRTSAFPHGNRRTLKS